ncbi:hypothetical protein [Sediminitomix flava]|uniref:Uncharacterized protein n=1 Tax=Sediminitomix flava TaxID=379075 RepID=A0A315ZB71_SEDFL|nr:hypothetical protein [Sediminitomix flava]PWJ42825.1 hypothetical protein BC781_102371 [Sediminitomix flava]
MYKIAQNLILRFDGKSLDQVGTDKYRNRTIQKKIIESIILGIDLFLIGADFFEGLTIEYDILLFIQVFTGTIIGSDLMFNFIPTERKRFFIHLDEEKFSFKTKALLKPKVIPLKKVRKLHVELDTLIFQMFGGKKIRFFANNINFDNEKKELLHSKIIETLQQKGVQVTVSERKQKVLEKSGFNGVEELEVRDIYSR